MQFEPLPRCPKCNHVRSPDATNPAWHCPSCGVAYNKVGADNEFREKMAARDQAARDRAESIRRKTTYRLVSNRRGRSTIFIKLVFMAAAFFIPLVDFKQQLSGSGTVTGLVLIFLLPFVGLFFLWHWFEAYRRLRLVADVPTSTIAAAAQGYVEISGRVERIAAFPLDTTLTFAPCVWCYSIRSSKSDPIITGVPFMLRDSTGACMVEMEVAEVVCDRMWNEYGAKEWSIRIGDIVHVIGHFTSGTREAQSQINYAVTHELATQMQRDPAAYVERFDINQDGKVDALEHDRARGLLVREKTQAKVLTQGGVHRIGPSPDGRPFLVIGADHDRFLSHYRRLVLFHLIAFIGAVGASAYFWTHPYY